MSYSPKLGSAFNKTRLRDPEHPTTCSGMCSVCGECPGLCEIGLAAVRGAGSYPVKTPGHGTMVCMAKWLDGDKKTAPIWLAFDFD